MSDYGYDPAYRAELDLEREITQDLCRTSDGCPGLFGPKLELVALKAERIVPRKPAARFVPSPGKARRKSA